MLGDEIHSDCTVAVYWNCSNVETTPIEMQLDFCSCAYAVLAVPDTVSQFSDFSADCFTLSTRFLCRCLPRHLVTPEGEKERLLKAVEFRADALEHTQTQTKRNERLHIFFFLFQRTQNNEVKIYYSQQKYCLLCAPVYVCELVKILLFCNQTKSTIRFQLPSNSKPAKKTFCSDHHLFSALRDGKAPPWSSLEFWKLVNFFFLTTKYS